MTTTKKNLYEQNSLIITPTESLIKFSFHFGNRYKTRLLERAKIAKNVTPEIIIMTSSLDIKLD